MNQILSRGHPRTDAITYLREAPLKWNETIPWAGRGRNFQAWELGWDVNRGDQEYLNAKLAEMETDFDLVMISNYYFESLVLLKDTLCMDWPDLYVPPTKVKERLIFIIQGCADYPHDFFDEI